MLSGVEDCRQIGRTDFNFTCVTRFSAATKVLSPWLVRVVVC